MALCLLHKDKRSITVSADALQRLLKRGDGDATLLYLALLRKDGDLLPTNPAPELNWSGGRMDAAVATLTDIGLLGRVQTPLLEPAHEAPTYQTQEIVARMEAKDAFPHMVDEIEKLLGKRLSMADTGVLLGLHDYVGLPLDVVYLLVLHCIERTEKRLGKGRRPGMKQIEKEGYLWHKLGIENSQAAGLHIQKVNRRQEMLPQLMRVLGLGERAPSPGEEKHLLAWLEMGFSTEAIALAYDKTVLRCHELSWRYINGILNNWHKQGLHTLEQIQQGDHKSPKTPRVASQQDMSHYVAQFHAQSEGGDNHGL